MTDNMTRITFKGRLIALVLGIVLTVAFMEFSVRIIMPNWHEFDARRFMNIVQVPGFGILALGKPGFDGYFAQNNGDFRHSLRINQFGLRNGDPVAAADGRIWVVGDSMAFGWGVERDQTYTEVLAKESNVPTYSVASPGATICGYQALFSRMPKELKPRAVVVGLILENDMGGLDCKKLAKESLKEEPLNLSLHTTKLFLMRQSALYNFIAVSVKRVGFLTNILIDIGLLQKEHTFHDLVFSSGLDLAISKSAEELANLAAMVDPGTPFSVVIAPARFELSDGNALFHEIRIKTVQALKDRNITVIDLYPDFKKAGFAPTHFAHDGHWSPLGHQVAGKALARWVKSLGLSSP